MVLLQDKQRFVRETNGSMYLQIFYLHFQHLWERFSESYIARSWTSSSAFNSQIFGLACSCSRTSVPYNAHASGGVLAGSALRAMSKRVDQIHTHAAFVFMEEVAGVTEQLTANPLYISMKKELMATSFGARESRFPVVILAALDELIADDAQSVFYRMLAWWLLLQSWGTLRFADHCGLEPRNVRFEGGALIAELTRSKTLGTEKPVSSHFVTVDFEAHIRIRNWVVNGWNLLQAEAPYERYYLLPAPSGNYKGFSPRSYDTIQHLQYKRVSWCHYHIVGPDSSMSLFGPLTADAFFYRQQRPSCDCLSLKTKNIWEMVCGGQREV